MLKEIRMANDGIYILELALVTMIIGLFICQDKRKNFLLPSLLISVFICNSIFYAAWNKINGYAYWRALWILPVVPVCAMIPAEITEKGIGGWKRILCFITILALIILSGQFMYANKHTTFQKADNADKLPNDVVLVGNYLLELEEEPRIVADAKISVYIRQYSAKIKTMYTRDVVYAGTESPYAAAVYPELSSDYGNLQIVADTMKEAHYDYLITDNEDDNRKIRLADAGFEFLKQINKYGVYRLKEKQEKQENQS